MLVDVHGDEELPYCFIAGSEGIPGWSDRMAMMQVGLVRPEKLKYPTKPRWHPFSGQANEKGYASEQVPVFFLRMQKDIRTCSLA